MASAMVIQLRARSAVAAALIAGLALAWPAASAQEQPLVLADGGRALLPVVIAASAPASTRQVAAELAAYLGRISGAAFQVESGAGDRGIVLGTLAEFPQPGLEQALAQHPGADGREAYCIRTRPGALLLIGATALGASHAAYRLLEELGCRWFFPAPEWEVVPAAGTLRFARDLDDRPAIRSRAMWFEAGAGGARQDAEFAAWRRRNRQAESFTVNAGHNLDEVVRRNQGEFARHPEYLALVDGKRQGPQLELADPEVRKLVVAYALDYFRSHPDADMVSLEPADDIRHSQSPESLRLGSVSDRVFAMANEAARALQQALPGKMVGLYSYNAHWDPPSFALEPNVHVLLSALGQGALTPAEREASWRERCRNLGFYEYFSVWLWSYDRLPGSWTNDCLAVQRRMRAIVALGGTSISAESTSSWGANGRGYYIANKLMWDPEADVAGLLADFYARAFGPGAGAMQRYYERLDPGARPFLSKHLLGLAFRDVDAAAHAAAGEPAVQARLDQIKQYLRYVHLDWLANRTGAGPQEKERLATAILTLLYRTRGSAFTAWEMARQNWGGNLVPGVDAPAWADARPYTHAESEAEFAEGLGYFQPRSLGDPVTFSSDLVAVRWRGLPEESARIVSRQRYQGPQTYALWSASGEPLEFTTAAGNAWHGINRFTVSDQDHHEIARGQPANDTVATQRIAVPHPGLYWLDYDDHGSGWSLTVAPGSAATIPLGSTRDYRTTEVMQEMYFYVPKGTRTIEYYYTRTAFHPGGPHQVLDAEGALAKAVDVDGDWVTVTVPAGMDGRLWRLRHAVLGLFWFNNLPNVMAASPQALLLPRELVERDGLGR
jgi:hypothetical protein